MLAHYLPWFANPQPGDAWGFHWTMNHFDPKRLLWDGRREVAAHDTPLIGLYDSGDPSALECQVLLMKLAGIDGVILDWYGPEAGLDHGQLHHNAQKLIPLLRKAGLRFAVCYEDQSLARRIDAGLIRPEESVARARAALRWLEDNWFKEPEYVRQEGRPALLMFGPQHLKPAEWTQVRESIATQPLVYGLAHLAKNFGLDGSFAWPPVSGGKTVSTAQWGRELDALDARRNAGERVISAAFPGFHDAYAQAGLHASYGRIDDRDGRTFSETLGRALKESPDLVQLATWNDYGEGTQIEPTRQQGFRYLETVQKARRHAGGPSSKFTAADLRLPITLYRARIRAGEDARLQADLDRAATLLFASDCASAEIALMRVERELAKLPACFAEEGHERDPAYRLHADVLYREDAQEEGMKSRCRLDVYTPAAPTKDSAGFATVVWFHGGGMTQGGRFVPVGLRHQGIAVVAVDYRRSPEAGSPAFIEDAAAAVAWTLKHIGEYGGSPGKVFVAGHSAGGYLACMAGLDRRWLAAQGAKTDALAGLIALSPQAITHFAIRKEQGLGELQPLVDPLAPLYHVRKNAPPMLLVTGDREKELFGRYEENAYLWRMLKLAGHPDVTLHELQGFDHGKMAEPALPLLLRFMREHARGSNQR